MRILVSAAYAALLISCSPPAREAPAPAPEQAAVEACNSVSPNSSQQVAIAEDPSIAVAADLRGGPITPGVYDLTSAHRIEAARGWNGTRAVALEVSEGSANGVVFNWAAVAPDGQTDTWTATFTDAPENALLTYTCGRIGEVQADFAANATALQLRIPDGANGQLVLNFQRRL